MGLNFMTDTAVIAGMGSIHGSTAGAMTVLGYVAYYEHAGEKM